MIFLNRPFFWVFFRQLKFIVRKKYIFLLLFIVSYAIMKLYHVFTEGKI